MWVGFVLRLGVAIWNGFFGPSFGAEGDALDQHLMALDYMRGIWPRIMRVNYLYAYGLNVFYSATVTSLFVGSVLSCLAWFASAQAFAASMRLLVIPRRSQAIAMLIFALTPSALLWTSVTMREPYQLMCVNLATLAALQIGIRGRHGYWLLMAFALAFGGILHGGLLGWGVVLVVTTLFWRVQPRRFFTPVRITAAAIVSVLILAGGYRAFTAMYAFPVDRGLAFAVDSYQRGGLSIGVRTDYRTAVAIKDNVDLLLFIPVALLQYLFEPMPWRVSSPADLVPVLENVIRAVLVLQALQSLLLLRGEARRAAMVVLVSYLVLETAWALGTFNWGTAARHHIPGMGLLLLAAFAYPHRQPLAVADRDPRRAGPPLTPATA
jgi:hypothetical protein